MLAAFVRCLCCSEPFLWGWVMGMDKSDKESVIDRVRAKRAILAQALKENPGLRRRLVEDVYPDNAHFIFELLQNAEDTGATEVEFVLRSNCLSFEHNGKTFTEADIWGITAVGEGTKHDDVETIGQFGVGFKAVFGYTESPRIWSPSFSFKIDELVLPSLLDNRTDLNGKTRFEFPFNNANKPESLAFKEVEDGLRDLTESTLLFLNCLQSISWKIGDNEAGIIHRIPHTENHIEVFKKTNGTTTASSHYLRFSMPIEGLGGRTQHKVAAAFSLEFLPGVKTFDRNVPTTKQMKIAPVDGQVSVFFPAKKETSGLRFHIHAPFVPDLSRASIKDTPDNESLFERLAELAAKSLYAIRDYGLLTVDFLSVLPNNQDSIPADYKIIRKSIIESMNDEALTPTHKKSHAPARHLLQARASLKNLLSEKDIKYLVEDGGESSLWAVGATQKNTNTDRFLESLNIRNWGLDEFSAVITNRASENMRYIPHISEFIKGPDSEFMDWLNSKSDEWHQQLYSLLFSELAASGKLRRLKECRLVRLSSGNYSVGSECFFPEEGEQDDDALPRVAMGVYSSRKSKAQQRENARNFLKEIGVRVVGEAEQVGLILKQRYTHDAKIPSKTTYRKDLKRFIALVEKDSPQAQIFKDYYIFECADNQWRQPSAVYLDEPYIGTGLSAYYSADHADEDKAYPLSELYREAGIPTKKVISFAKAVGANVKLPISTCSCTENPEWSYLCQVGGVRYSSPMNEDYEISGLAELLAKPTLQLSQLVWRTMVGLDDRYLVATYRLNISSGSREAASSLVHVLRSAAWVPQGKDMFVRPAEASSELLPDGFLFDPGWHWLKKLKWSEEIAERAEERRRKETSARDLGFQDQESLEQAQWFAALPPEVRKRIIADAERHSEHERPDRSPAHPEQRAARVGEMAAQAPDRYTEERMRSVLVGDEEIKAKAAHYLLQQYSIDGKLICQICKEPMPFNLDDGSPFFEKVRFISELKKSHRQNYLALCPNHSAMFMYVNPKKDSMLEVFAGISGNDLELVLAQEDTTIYFTKTHIADLKKIIEVESGKGSDGDKADS